MQPLRHQWCARCDCKVVLLVVMAAALTATLYRCHGGNLRWQEPEWQQSRPTHGWRAIGRDAFTSAVTDAAATSPGAAAASGKVIGDTASLDAGSPDAATRTPAANPEAVAKAPAAHRNAASDGSTVGSASQSAPVSSPSQPQPTPAPTSAPSTCWHLNEADARAVATNGTIIFSVVNEHSLKLARNWVHYLRELGADNILVGVYESETAAALVEWGIPCLNISDFLVSLDPEGGFGWGDANWWKLVWAHVRILPELLRFGINVLWSDADIIWFKNPSHLFDEFPEVDLIMGSDHVGTTLQPGEAYFEDPSLALEHTYNSGIMAMRSEQVVIDLMEAWKAEEDAGRQKSDQMALNQELLRAGIWHDGLKARVTDDNPKVALAFRGRVRLGIMPVSLFMTGRTYCLQRLDKRMGVEPWSFHLTWVALWGGNTVTKTSRMQEARLWKGEPPESTWYGGNSDETFLAMDLVQPQVPYDNDGVAFGQWKGREEEMIAYHLAAVEFQLAQIHAGWSIALALNRTFILPKMVCFCDHSWIQSTDCRALWPDSEDFPLPYACPHDFIFDPERMLNVGEGPLLRHRYFSFLEDPEVDPKLLKSQLRLRTSPDVSCASVDGCAGLELPLCTEDSLPANAGNSSTLRLSNKKWVPMRTRCLPRGLQSQQLAAALAPLATTRVLHIADAPRAWAGWSDSAEGEAAKRRMDVATFSWYHRSTKAAKASKRPDSEPYLWRPFKDLQVFDAAAASDGAINARRLLAERDERPWILPEDGVQFTFRGEHASPTLWGQ